MPTHATVAAMDASLPVTPDRRYLAARMRLRMSLAISRSYSTVLFLAVISTLAVESVDRLTSAVTSYSAFVPTSVRWRPLSSVLRPVSVTPACWNAATARSKT